ncbi:MAG TPA: peptidylprolyl isomerase, partial [Planctomycetota bacterium]|nr:peptidylprolyl isomerase [Planctomycetota bacterium]
NEEGQGMRYGDGNRWQRLYRTLAISAVWTVCSIHLIAAEPIGPKPVPVAPILVPKPDPNDPNDPDNRPERKPLDDILVLVNSIPVYSHSLSDVVDALVKASGKTPDPVQLHNIRKQELQNLVQMEITRQFVRANKLKVDEAKFQQFIDFFSKEAQSRYGEPLQAVLRRNGRDYASWYKAQQYVFMLRDFAANQLTDKELDVYIKEKQDTLPLRRVRHILVAHKDSVKYAVPERTKEQALAKAQELVKRLQAGESFAELAMAEGDSPEALDGGLLPFLPKKPSDPAMQLAKPFIEAAYKIEKVGDLTLAPVETDYGYHVIELVDLRRDVPNAKYPLSNLRKYLMNTPEHYNQLVESKWQETIDEVRRRSTIQFFGEFDELNQKSAEAPKTPPGTNAPLPAPNQPTPPPPQP